MSVTEATIRSLDLDEPPVVVTVGASMFADALENQAVTLVRVEWSPPADDTGPDLARIAADPRHTAANAEASRRLLAAKPQWVGMTTARDALGLASDEFLHAGPPIDWSRACGPLRGALAGAMVYEGLAANVDDAVKRAAAGGIALSPCHGHAVVGPMAGVVSASMPLSIIEDATTGKRSYCTLNEGLGAVLRYGAFGTDVIDRLQWMQHSLAPLLHEALRAHGPVDLVSLIGQALQMGDECHNRNRAATSLLLRELTPHLIETIGNGRSSREVATAYNFLSGNDHFFLNLSMPAGKVAADAARDVPGSSLVVAMARNGTDFGIQLSGTGDQWFTAPAPDVAGMYLPGYGPEDANPDIGDSTITETVGYGGMAMAAAPAIVRFVGGDPQDAVRRTLEMYEITLAEHPAYQIPILGFRGTPTGIDATLVARTGVVPAVNTGIAGKEPGVGQVGAGLVTPPMSVFTDAVRALAAVARPVA
jgi:hypothetical protein